MKILKIIKAFNVLIVLKKTTLISFNCEIKLAFILYQSLQK